MDLKGKSKKQQQERFIILLIGEYCKQFGKGVAKSLIFDTAKTNHLLDNNFRIYFSQNTKYFIKSNELLRLNPEGQNRYLQILNEIRDQNTSGFAYWKGAKPREKRPRVNKSDLEKINQWIALETEMTNFDVRTLTTLTEKCMFAIFDITKSLNVVEAVKSSIAFEYLKARYKTLSITKKQFSDTLARKDNEDKFKRNDDGFYYLTPKAEEIIRSKVSQK